MASLYAFGSGSCRGHGWKIRETMEVAEVVGILKTAIQIRAVSETAYEEYVEKMEDEGEVGEIVVAIVTGGRFVVEDGTLDAMQKRLLNLVTSLKFSIELEESSFGVSETREGAIEAYAMIGNEGGWDE